MHSLPFYAKLALSNLWRNRSTYLPYLLACTVSIFTLYTLWAINANGALDGMRGESVVKSFTAIGAIIMALFCSLLIFYTNSFLMKRRKKELGLYSILGMEKKNIACLMFFETFFIAVLAIVLGLVLGMLLSQLLFWLLLRMVRFTVMLSMPPSLMALGYTAAFFGFVFACTLLANLWQVKTSSPIGLMAGANQGEKEPKSSKLLTIFGLLCLAGGYFIALYFTSPVEVIMTFLPAVLLVILGTYCLFTSGSITLLKMLRKNKKYYYQPGHFISVSGMIYRMRQNAAGLATICILSCMVLVTVSSTVALNFGAEDSLKAQYPYAYSMQFSSAEDASAILAGAQAVAEGSGVSLGSRQQYEENSFVAVQNQAGLQATNDPAATLGANYVSLLNLADYNRCEGQNLQLAEGEALLLVSGGRYDEETLAINGIDYRVYLLESFGKKEASSRDLLRSFTLVLPSQAAVQAVMQAGGEVSNQAPSYIVGFDIEGSEAGLQRFETEFYSYLESTHTQENFRYNSREGARQNWYASNGGFLFLGLYFGILFMLAAALIIYYKQLSEGYDDAGRFEILQKVGMGEAEVKKTINSQILAVFFLPLVAAVVHIVVAFFPISRAMVIFGVLNLPLLVLASALTVLAYVLVYLLVFRQTAHSYFRIVRRQAATQ